MKRYHIFFKKGGDNIKKIIFIILMAIVLFIPTTVSAAEREVNINYFGVDSCTNCQEIKSFLKSFKSNISDEVKNSNYVDSINIIYNDTAELDVRNLQLSYSKAYDVPDNLSNIVPAIYVGEYYFIGLEDIKNGLPQVINSYLYGDKEYNELEINNLTDSDIKETQEKKFNSFNPFAIFLAGLLDGFNPCAIAMLLFFITFVSIGNKGNKSILYIGLSYIIGTFITYFGIGLGLFKFAYLFNNAKNIMFFIYGFTIIVSIFLAIQNLIEFKEMKKGNLDKVKLQLPKKIKHTIHNFIRKNSSSKAIILSAFISGVVVSFLEFFCTGQIYLPTIVYVLSSGSSATLASLYLFLYNFAFVIPLIVICIAIYIGKQVMDVSQLLLDKLYIIKLIVGIFFIIISILMSVQIYNIL